MPWEFCYNDNDYINTGFRFVDIENGNDEGRLENCQFLDIFHASTDEQMTEGSESEKDDMEDVLITARWRVETRHYKKIYW